MVQVPRPEPPAPSRTTLEPSEELSTLLFLAPRVDHTADEPPETRVLGQESVHRYHLPPSAPGPTRSPTVSLPGPPQSPHKGPPSVPVPSTTRRPVETAHRTSELLYKEVGTDRRPHLESREGSPEPLQDQPKPEAEPDLRPTELRPPGETMVEEAAAPRPGQCSTTEDDLQPPEPGVTLPEEEVRMEGDQGDGGEE